VIQGAGELPVHIDPAYISCADYTPTLMMQSGILNTVTASNATKYLHNLGFVRKKAFHSAACFQEGSLELEYET
jgi:hypothetical protein